MESARGQFLIQTRRSTDYASHPISAFWLLQDITQSNYTTSSPRILQPFSLLKVILVISPESLFTARENGWSRALKMVSRSDFLTEARALIQVLGTVKIWDTRSGHIQRNYSHGVPVNDVVIHPNQGELISCDRGGNVRIWDLGENKCSHQLVPEEDKSVASVTVATDGSLLCAAVSSSVNGAVFVWRLITVRDVTSLVPVTKFRAHGTYITRVLLSPDVRKLATCSADHTARIWTVDTENVTMPSDDKDEDDKTREGPGTEEGSFALENELDGHQRWVWDCAFSADSAYLVTACSDHYARLWELASKNIIRQYNGHHRGAVCVALNDYSETR